MPRKNPIIIVCLAISVFIINFCFENSIGLAATCSTGIEVPNANICPAIFLNSKKPDSRLRTYLNYPYNGESDSLHVDSKTVMSAALIVTVSKYPAAGKEAELPAAEVDSANMTKFLKDQGFDLIVTLKDSQVTKQNLDFFLTKFFASRVPADASYAKTRFVFAYSGHAISDSLTRLILWNGAGTSEDDSTMSMDQVRSDLAELNKVTHVLAIVNACYSGDLNKGATWSATKEVDDFLLIGEPGAWALTSSDFLNRSVSDPNRGAMGKSLRAQGGSLLFDAVINAVEDGAGLFAGNQNDPSPSESVVPMSSSFYRYVANYYHAATQTREVQTAIKEKELVKLGAQYSELALTNSSKISNGNFFFLFQPKGGEAENATTANSKHAEGAGADRTGTVVLGSRGDSERSINTLFDWNSDSPSNLFAQRAFFLYPYYNSAENVGSIVPISDTESAIKLNDVSGINLNSRNSALDLKSLASRNDIAFVYLRATVGSKQIWGEARKNVAAAKKINKLNHNFRFGISHVFNFCDAPEDQLKNLEKFYGQNKLPLPVAIEFSYSRSNLDYLWKHKSQRLDNCDMIPSDANIGKRLHRLVKLILDRTHRAPIVYLPAESLEDNNSKAVDAYVRKLPLWIADYSFLAKIQHHPRNPHWTLWQSSPGLQSNNNDTSRIQFEVFNGNQQKFQDSFALGGQF